MRVLGRILTLAACAAGGLLAAPALAAGAIKDAESASHGDEASAYQVVDSYSYPGFKVVQFNLAVLSHYSYMLFSGGQALVVDPGRDVPAYVDAAKREGAVIRGVFLTHSHADFVAGHTELAKAVGCPIYANAATQAGYPHQPLKEGSTLEIGQAQLTFVETPGHTPDGLCAYVRGTPRNTTPEVIFTGDTLFVGSIGRPDLMGGTMAAATLASMAFDTWTNKLSKAGDSAVIFPAHGAGSLCGAHLSDRPFSTIGEEKRSNAYLQYTARSDFIAAVLDGLPEAPQYFQHNAKLNHDGPPLVDWHAPLPAPVAADPLLAESSKTQVVDLRSADAYAAGHIPNALNIAVRGRLETWVGIMVPWGSQLVVCGSETEAREALRRLQRVGYTGGWLSFEAWQKAGRPVKRNDAMTPQALYAQMTKGEAPVVVDIRLPSEWMGLRIGTVVNLPLNQLAVLARKLDPGQPVVTVCNSAYRSSMAVGVLERQGFRSVRSLQGGSEAWLAAGLPVYGADVAKSPTANPAPKRLVPLPERLAAAELQRLQVDLPGSYDLVDIRPAAQFADYSLPGSRNVEIADVVGNPAFLTGPGPLIIVDRDGSLAMAVGGILAQKTQRPIKVLYGGLEAYWEATEGAGTGAGGRLRPAAGAPGAPVAPMPPPAAAPGRPLPPVPAAPPAAPAPAAPKKRSAGC